MSEQHPEPHQSEVLETGGGAPVAPASRSRGGRRVVLIGGGVVLLAGLGVGGWAAWGAFFGSGPQPAEALPADTVVYVSVDLDPSGQQKLEALDVLEKFPGFTEETGLDRDSDLREELFGLIQDDGACGDLDFDDDVAPWLGDRFAVAGIDLGDDNAEGLPYTPVGVVQVADAEAARAGFEEILDCTGASEESGGWAVEGDWAVVAPTSEAAEVVLAGAAEAPLSDDADFQRWTEAAGDPGILTAYAAPELGDLVSEVATALAPLLGGPTCLPTSTDEAGDVPCGNATTGTGEEPGVPELVNALAGFEGGALTVRFADGGLEVEAASAADALDTQVLTPTDRGGDVVETLPADTALALGVGFEDGWIEDYLAEIDAVSADLFGGVDVLTELEELTGLSVDDLETLFGESAAIAVGPEVDPATFEQDEMPADLRFAAKVQGDAPAIEALLEDLLARPDVPAEIADAVDVATDGDVAVLGVDDAWTDAVLADGDLGDSDLYQDVVPHSDDASAVLFLDADELDWLGSAIGGTQLDAWLEPVRALGLSSWTDDDGAHVLLKITTD